jgi:hypothetical protein
MSKRAPGRRERRAGRRARLFGLVIRHLTADVPVVVRDVGVESFAIESSAPLALNSEQRFEFSAYGLTATVLGIVRRCDRCPPAAGGARRYIVGLTTTFATPADRAALSGCLNVLGRSESVRSQR